MEGIHLVNNASSCSPAAVGVSYESKYSKIPKPGYYVTAATVGNIPSNCFGVAVNVSVTNSASQRIGMGSAGITSTSVEVPISPNGALYPYAHDVTGVTVSFTQTTSTGNLEIITGQTFHCSFLTIAGNVTVDRGGTFNGNHCTISGNLTSVGTVSLSSSLVQGNIQSSAGQMTLTAGSSVGGNVQPDGGGPFTFSGSSVTGNVQPQNLSGRVIITGDTISGSLQLQGLTSSAPGVVCSTSVKKNMTVQNNSEPFQIGGSAICGGNTVGGNLQVQSNTGELTIGSGNPTSSGASMTGNAAFGNIQVLNNLNSNLSTLAGNWTAKSCTLSGDSPRITVPSPASNFAQGTNRCKVSA